MTHMLTSGWMKGKLRWLRIALALGLILLSFLVANDTCSALIARVELKASLDF